MVGARKAFDRDKVAGKGAETALHAVADDCPADLLSDGEADANSGVAIRAVADQQDETWRCGALPGIGSQEIATLA
jgi:hypothetical protein